MNRLLDYPSSVIRQLSKKEILDAISNSEGRVMMAETIGTTQPLLGNISNVEFVASLGVELVNLNVFDVFEPIVNGLPNNKDLIRQIIDLTGCLVGINLEPINEKFINRQEDNIWQISKGRLANVENASIALQMGVKFITLTGNPGLGVDNATINATLKKISSVYHDDLILIAGKMHASGIKNETNTGIITKKDIDDFVNNGADIILLPAAGTVPGITLEYIHDLIEHIHSLNKLALTAIGTSQEGSDVATIKQIALMCKMAGADIHHIGDAGYLGMALPENIFAYSVTIRGIRHTYRRMAMSIKR